MQNREWQHKHITTTKDGFISNPARRMARRGALGLKHFFITTFV